MMRNKLAKVVLTVGALHSGLVSALGLGELALDSTLNQPFRAEIPLRDIGELSVEQIKVQLADAGAFENAGVDRSQFLSSLQFQVELLGGGNGRIVITTAKAVVEPYLDFIVEARWPNGKMIREYTVLLDLPVYADDSPARGVDLSSAAPVSRQTQPTQASAPVVSQAPSQELGGAIGPVDRAAPTARSVDQQQVLPTSDNPSEYRVQHHDTMWRIANKLRPSSYVTTQQTMLALVKKNPKAFVNGNVNQLKSGYVLRLPSEAEVRAVDHNNAVEEIRLQAKEWRGERVARPANAKSNTAEASTNSQPSATPMAPQLDATDKTQAPAAAKGDEAVKFSLGNAGDVDAGDEVNALRDKVREEQESLEKSKLENGAMQNRVVEMEKQIQALQSLITLKNTQLAAIQNGQQAPESPAMSAEDIAALEAEALAPLPSADSVEANSDTRADSAAVTDTAKSPAADKSVAPKPTKPAAETPLQASQSWISQNIVTVVGLLLALLALLVLFVRRRKAAEEDADLAGFDEGLAGGDGVASPVLFASGGDFDLDPAENTNGAVDDDADPVFSAEDFDFDKLADDSTVDDVNAVADDVIVADDSVFDEQGASAASSAAAVLPQTGDVVAEAEIYVAYGRYDQAASLLRTAIAQDPENTELRLKLIDIYLDTRDQDNFESAYHDLQALNDDAAIARVKESMSAIEGVSHWLGEDSATSSDSTLNVGSSNAADVDFGDDVDVFSIDDEGIDFELDDALDSNIEAGGNLGLGAADANKINSGAGLDAGAEKDTLASLDIDLADLDFDFDGDFGVTSADSNVLDGDTAALNVDSPLEQGDKPFTPADGAGDDVDLSFEEVDDASLEVNSLNEAVAPVVNSESDNDVSDELVAFDDDEIMSFDLAELEAEELESNGDSKDSGALTSLDADEMEFESLDLGGSGLGDSDIAGSHLSNADQSVAPDLAALTPESEDDEEEIDLDLSEFDLDLADTSVSANSPLETSSESDDVELDLSDFDMPSEIASGSDTLSSVAEDDLEIDETFFLGDDEESDKVSAFDGSTNLNTESVAENTEPSADTSAPTVGSLNIDGDAISVEDLVFDEFDAGEDDVEGFDSLVDSESVATKLDLARAYIDMGDGEGAREMLEEVLQEGDIQQQSDAQALLDNIG
ncbi:MAG: tetratricopeptide repeat protein [Zhongshania sp.]|jgi:pilus assembly protein FimV|nr:tetratricopeptide repeat protein [Zhongshania sp.]